VKPLYLDTAAFGGHSYGPAHPMRLERLMLTTELLKAYGILGDKQVREPQPADEEDLLRFHTGEYLDLLVSAGTAAAGSLWRAGMGVADNPVFDGLYDVARLSVGASLGAAQAVASGEWGAAFNIAGGMHHAMPGRASGFCYLNDAVVAIAWLVDRGCRVAYVDLDAHHGDGVQAAFYGTDQVLTISLHQSGRTLFPGTGFEYEVGTGSGTGYSVNVPLLPHSGDESFLLAFESVVPPLLAAYCPEVVMTQLGVDPLRSDPLAMLDLTTNAFEHAVRRFKDLCPKWVALGGGGYDLNNVPRAWALAWAIMNGVELPDELPKSYLELAREHGVTAGLLRDEPAGPDDPRCLEEVHRVLGFLGERVFPRVRAAGG